MMTTNYRAMCADLIDALDSGIPAGRVSMSPLVDRARSMLAQPDPLAPTNEELKQLLFDDHRSAIEFACDTKAEGDIVIDNHIDFARAVLDRWGTPTPDTESLRSALRECGRAAGAFISDECSDEFLLQVPSEVRLALTNTVWADIHYAWELQDADGEWQAGGSANSLDDVQREGSRYLQTYAQDGPHKLIIQRHCVTTINEVTP